RGGISATRCATQLPAAATVAVLLPLAPALAWIPSAPVERDRLAGMLVERTVYSWVKPCPASWVALTFPCPPYNATSMSLFWVVVRPVAVALPLLPELSLGVTSTGLVGSAP